MAQIWTDEMRDAAAERIRLHKPWLKATGPKTPEGKAKSSRNAYRGGRRPAQRQFLAMIKSALQAVDVSD